MSTAKEDKTQIGDQETSTQSQEDTQIDGGATTTRSHSFTDLFKVQASEIKRLQANNKELKQELDDLKIENNELEKASAELKTSIEVKEQKNIRGEKFGLFILLFLVLIMGLLIFIAFKG